MIAPRLVAPLLIRRPDLLQIGVESPQAVLLPGPPADQAAALLGRLDGSTSTVGLETQAARLGLSAAAWHSLLADLSERGLLISSGEAGRARHGRVTVVGTGAIAADLVGLLARTQVEQIVVADPHGAPDAAPALLRRLRRDLTGETASLSSVRGRSGPGHRSVDLTVLAGDHAEANRAVAGDLVRTDQPHLVLGCRQDTVSVGPLVLPGRTPCLRCLDLTRSDRDPGWPDMVRQLESVIVSPSALGRSWAAATATVHILALLATQLAEETRAGHADPPVSPTVATVLELDTSTGAERRRRFSAHAGCGCHWGGAAEWVP